MANMKQAIKSFSNDVKKLQALLVEKDSEIKVLQEKNQYLLEQFRLAQHKQFGKSSEVDPGQGELFNEAEQLVDETTEPEKETISYTRNKPKRKPLPKDLPRETQIIDIPDDEKNCDCCGHDLHRMGEKKSEKLEFIPAQVKVIETIRPQYSCRHCESSATKTQIKIAPPPLSPIPKSIATPSLLSQIITSKYQYALPLYRQETMFKQHGIDLNRKAMSEWMIKTSTLFKPIIEHLHQYLLKQPVIQADETTLKVIHEDKSKCYMWVYCSGLDSPNENQKGIKNIVLYDYQASRAGSCAVNYLEGFNGYLQADGYKGYEQVDAKLIGCMAHARRKFIEAQTAQPKNKSGRADEAIKAFKKLYRVEKEMKDLPANEKYEIRQEKSLPLLNDFKKWLDKSIQQVLPKSAIGKAIQYSLNQWHKLSGYIKSGDINIDNNRAERAIKPFVIGRKNWMFCNTANGANASAILYSLIETAKANGLTPFNYLRFLLEELPKAPDDLEYLMPWNVKLEATI
jgi:transposase